MNVTHQAVEKLLTGTKKVEKGQKRVREKHIATEVAHGRVLWNAGVRREPSGLLESLRSASKKEVGHRTGPHPPPALVGAGKRQSWLDPPLFSLSSNRPGQLIRFHSDPAVVRGSPRAGQESRQSKTFPSHLQVPTTESRSLVGM